MDFKIKLKKKTKKNPKKFPELVVMECLGSSCGASCVGIVASVLTVGGPHSDTDGVGVNVDEKAKLLLTVAP